MRYVFFLLVIIGLAACQPPTPTPNPGVIAWARDSAAIVFRADVSGGAAELASLNHVPLCTIYGDNVVVWQNEVALFDVQTLTDRLSDETIRAFIEYLTFNERAFSYFSPLLTDEPDPNAIPPVVETIEITISGVEHRADSFAGWGGQWFQRVLAACKSLSQTPVLFEPIDGGWATVEAVERDPQALITPWDSTSNGVSLASVASGGTQWVSRVSAVALWRPLHSKPSTLLFEEDGVYYRAALQVPRITRTSPPAPES